MPLGDATKIAVPPKSIIVSVAAVKTGLLLTVIEFETDEIAPVELVVVNSTVYVPEVVKQISGFCSVEVDGLAAPPKSHSHEATAPVLKSVMVIQSPTQTGDGRLNTGTTGSQSITEIVIDDVLTHPKTVVPVTV